MSRSFGSVARSGIVWSGFAFASTKLLSFLTTLVLARLLAPEDFGVLAAILAFLAFIELGGDLGMHATVVYEQEEGITRRVHVAFTLNFAIVSALTVVAFVLAGPIADFFGVGAQGDLFRLATLGMPLRALGNIADSLLLRDLAFRRRVVPEVVSSVVKAAVSIALAGLGAEAAALVIGLLVGTAVRSVLQLVLTGFRPRLTIDVATVRTMARYGSASALLEVMALVANRLDTVVIGRALGPTALGLYTVAFRIPEILIDALAWTVSGVAFPALSRVRAGGEGLGNAVLALLRYQAIYAGSMATVIALLAEPALGTLFGDEWRRAAPVLAAVAIMSAVSAVAFPIGDALKALGRQRVLVLLNVAHIPVLAAAVLLAVPGGIDAVAWARAGVAVLFALSIVVAAAAILGIAAGPLARSAWPGLAASAGAGGAVTVATTIVPATDLPTLLWAGLCGVLGAVAALRLLAPGTFGEIAQIVRALGVRLSRPPAVAGE